MALNPKKDKNHPPPSELGTPPPQIGTPPPPGQSPAEALEDFATLDHDRTVRCGHGEVVYAAGKQPEEVARIIARLMEEGPPCVLATRCSEAQVQRVRETLGERWPIEVGRRSGTLIVGRPPESAPPPESTPPPASNAQDPGPAGDREANPEAGPGADGAGDPGAGGIVIVTAGTSDLTVAEEAAMTCRALGWRARSINDVGVAGLHRVLGRLSELRSADCVVVVAGMEGALPSVVGGLVEVPVIAVPTSVGYGASFGGLSALLGMLNTCASGVTVVNIDNGFGAGYAACQIMRLLAHPRPSARGNGAGTQAHITPTPSADPRP